MTAHILKVETWDDVPRTITILQLAGADHRVRVLQAFYAGRIATWEARRTGCTGQCKRFLAMVRKQRWLSSATMTIAPRGPTAGR